MSIYYKHIVTLHHLTLQYVTVHDITITIAIAIAIQYITIHCFTLHTYMVHWLCLSHRGVYQMASMEHPWLCMLGASSLFTLVTKMGAAWRHSGPAPGIWIPCLKKNPGKTGVTPMIHEPNYVNSSLKLGFWRYYIYIHICMYIHMCIYIYVYIY